MTPEPKFVYDDSMTWFETATTQASQVLEHVPGSAIVGAGDDGPILRVPWDQHACEVLANLRAPHLPPMLRDYEFKCKYPSVFPHQYRIAGALSTHSKFFCLADMGTAKTLSTLFAVDYLISIGAVRQVLVVCPKSIVRNAWAKEIAGSFPHLSATILVHADPLVRRRKATALSDIHITNYSGVEICYEEMKGRYDLIVVDECFVAGTKVLTPTGDVAIEAIRPGDIVTTEFGPRVVERTGARLVSEVIHMELSDGRRITCTAEHPFFTDLGWVAAKDSFGRRVLDYCEVSSLLSGFSTRHGDDALRPEAWDDVGDVLREILRSEVSPQGRPYVHREGDGRYARSWVGDAARCVHQDRGTAGGEPGAQVGHRTETDGQGWEWASIPVRGVGSRRDAGVDTAVCGPVGQEARWLSDELQAGLRDRGPAHRSGAGWRFAPESEGSRARREEGREAEGTWVVGVSRAEQDSPVTVFNLAVEGVPHFFAGGVLTHNCTAYKKYGTRRWKFLRPLVAEAARCWMLTGTPSVQYPLDAYGQVKLMYQGAWDMTETRFKMLTMTQHSKFRWVPRDDAAATVHEAMQPAIVVHKRDVLLDLPPVTFSTRDVELSAEQKRLMTELRKKAVVDSKCGAEISAVHAAALRTKLLQIASGTVYDDADNVVEVDCKPRLAELLEIVEQVRASDNGVGKPEHKVIVVCAFTHTVDRVAAFLNAAGFKFAVMYGAVSLRQRERILESMETTREFDGIVAYPEVLSHGVTLTSCTATVMFTPFDKAEVALQVQNRMDRPGQRHPMQIIRLSGCSAEEILYDRMDMRIDFHKDVVHQYSDFVDAL